MSGSGVALAPRNRARLAIALALLAVCSGCGYALVGKGVTTDASILTAVGNDYGFDAVFRRQVEAHGKPGDVALGISTSGRSPNVIEGLRVARDRGLLTVVDAVVEGELLSYVVVPVGFADEGGARTQPNRYSVTLTARIRYAKAGNPEAIWENDAFAFRDEYDVSEDPAAFFHQEDQALDRLSAQFARSLVAAMLEAF